jgi:hypothetical protein
MKSPQPEKKRAPAEKPSKSAGKSSAPTTKAPAVNKGPKVAFPKKNQPPTAAAFAARLPLALGKRFEMVRSFLLRQKDMREDVYFYGPKTGWALRYLVGEHPLCSVLLYEDVPVGILSLPALAISTIDWKNLSPVGQLAHKHAHGSPSMLWLDVPLAGTGAADFKAIVRAKLATVAPPKKA